MDKSFLKNVLKLSSGTSAAYIFALAISPLLTRLFSPSDFGELQFFQSLLVVASLISTGCYHFVIISPKNELDALGIIKGIITITLSVSGFLLVLAVLIQFVIGFPIVEKPILIPLFCLTLVLNTFLLVFDYWFLRPNNYKTIAISKINRSFFTGASQLTSGFFQVTGGLIYGLIIGRLITLAYYMVSAGRRFYSKLLAVSFHQVKTVLLTYRKQASHILPSTLLSSGSTELVIFLIASLFGEVLLGFYALAYRVLSVPSALLGTSIGEVYFRKATEQIQTKKALKPLLLKTWAGLFLIGIVPTVVLFTLGEPLLSWVFGSEWVQAGTIAEILSPLLLVNFISSPTGKTFIVINEQSITPILSTLLMICRVGGLLIGFYFFDFYTALALMVWLHILALLIYNSVLVYYLTNYEKSL